MALLRRSHLPRLPRIWYQGRAAVLWTHTTEVRATGWLGPEFYARFREVMLHACARYALACPAYVLMPDHGHVLWLGLGASSDQWEATRFLRKHLARLLGPVRLQDRAHDHVLRENEREKGALASACQYIWENPQRAGFIAKWEEWPFAGAMLVGYPNLDPREAGYWEEFWKLHARIVEADAER